MLSTFPSFSVHSLKYSIELYKIEKNFNPLKMSEDGLEFNKLHRELAFYDII